MKWQAQWSASSTRRLTRDTTPKVSFSHSKTKIKAPNSLVGAYTRLGHCGLQYILNKIGAKDSENCLVCNVPETVKHYLLECSQFYLQRQKLFRSMDTTPENIDQLSTFFSESTEVIVPVIQYIRDSNQK